MGQSRGCSKCAKGLGPVPGRVGRLFRKYYPISAAGMYKARECL